MKNLKYRSISSYYGPLMGNFRYFHNKPGSIVIAAAARTPWGKYQGQLSTVNAWQLGQLAVEAVVKQSAIPLNQIRQIFMNESPKLHIDYKNGLMFSNFLKKSKYTPKTVVDCNEPKMQLFLNALESLKCQHQSAVVVGGLQSASRNEFIKNNQLEVKNTHRELFGEMSLESVQKYMAENRVKYSKSQMEGVFDSEIVPLKTIRQEECKRRTVEITNDEILCGTNGEDNIPVHYSDGAAALVVTTFDNARDLNLSPLAVIVDFEYIRNSSNILWRSRECVEKLISKIKMEPAQIQLWEIEDYFPQLVDFIKHDLSLNLDIINAHGGSLIFGHSPSASLTRLLTYLTHSLNPFEYGCAISCSFQESLALIIQKLPSSSTAEHLPLVTLYTKDNCPLCDDLVDELQLYFKGEYELEKVFVDTEENIRFLSLYRFDIPVVFLNNQFLCMHRLNRRLFRKRLDLLKK